MSFEEVAEGVVVYRHSWADGTCALLFGDGQAAAVDGGGDVADGQAMAAYLRKAGHEPTRLLYTHGHSDHVWGALPLGGGEVIAHELTPDVMRRQLPAWAERWQVAEHEAAARVPWPTVTFTEQLFVHLGSERRLRLFRTPGHSVDGVSILVEDVDLLIAGDCAASGILPALGDGDGRTLEASLRMLADMHIKTLVPGHGPVVHGDAVTDCLLWAADYLLAVRRRVRDLLADGVAEPSVPAAVPYDEFVGTRFDRQQHGMEKRHAGAVHKIATEERHRMPPSSSA